MLSYFSFHWHYTAELLDQVRGGERTLRHVVMTATRKQRVQRVMKTLKMKRVFSTLLDELKAMRGHKISSVADEEMEATNPASPISRKPDAKAQNPDAQVRYPVLLLIGGGMGAGKSTVVEEILQSSFWAGSSHSAVVVQADAFKETDVVYQALSSREHGDVAEAAQLVHQSSTLAASSLLVAALNEGRDVIFDGTMSWQPFVLQTIAMARDIHRRPYRMGAGYKSRDDGVIDERYWEPVHEYVDQNGSRAETASAESSKSEKGCNGKNPYRIELVAVTCDAQVAVVRGIRRAVSTKRSVPIEGQLRSHKMFASSLEKYCQLVDNVKMYSTSWTGKKPELIGWKNSNSKMMVDVEAFRAVKQLADLNPNAGSVFELYSNVRCNQVWHEVVLSPERAPRQAFLRKELDAVELHRSFSLSSMSSSEMSLSSRSTSSFSTDLSRESSISDFGSASSLFLSPIIEQQQREQLLQSA
ncbi:hypothetical protein O6H91_09G109100 [Diphasiastrum complanatum]|uniref:Uncharacterized protein n=1 Tax=Diphasiastrum complanatum TaxID=34168 RepID=A0ACC2CSW7_DIPCM|nr:hypothetical protein O6H91_09G109100 [Diphasiastrum complanatum]